MWCDISREAASTVRTALLARAMRIACSVLGPCACARVHSRRTRALAAYRYWRQVLRKGQAQASSPQAGGAENPPARHVPRVPWSRGQQVSRYQRAHNSGAELNDAQLGWTRAWWQGTAKLAVVLQLDQVGAGSQSRQRQTLFCVFNHGRCTLSSQRASAEERVQAKHKQPARLLTFAP